MMTQRRDYRIQNLLAIGCCFVRCPRTGRIIFAPEFQTHTVCTCPDRIHAVAGLQRATATEYVDQNGVA